MFYYRASRHPSLSAACLLSATVIPAAMLLEAHTPIPGCPASALGLSFMLSRVSKTSAAAAAAAAAAAGVMPRSNAVADDLPELQPLGDRAPWVEETADVMIGGVVLPDSAKERPLR